MAGFDILHATLAGCAKGGAAGLAAAAAAAGPTASSGSAAGGPTAVLLAFPDRDRQSATDTPADLAAAAIETGPQTMLRPLRPALHTPWLFRFPAFALTGSGGGGCTAAAVAAAASGEQELEWTDTKLGTQFGDLVASEGWFKRCATGQTASPPPPIGYALPEGWLNGGLVTSSPRVCCRRTTTAYHTNLTRPQLCYVVEMSRRRADEPKYGLAGTTP